MNAIPDMDLPVSPKTRSDVIPGRLETLRESCDNCAKSKVRCGKEQPQCQRCMNQGVRCMYSPSQRMRKRKPRSVRVSQQPRSPSRLAAAEPSHGAVTPPPSAAALPLVPNTVTADLRQTSVMHNHSSAPFNLVDADLDSLMTWDDSALASSGQEASAFPESQFLTLQWLKANPIDSSFLQDDDTHCIFPVPPDLTDKPDPMPPRRTYAEPSINERAIHKDCAQLASLTFQNLDVPSRSCTPRTYLDGLHRSSRLLDDVLKSNQSALDNVMTILSCPCSIDTHIGLLVAIIMSKILAWYQASLNATPISTTTTAATSSSSINHGDDSNKHNKDDDTNPPSYPASSTSASPPAHAVAGQNHPTTISAPHAPAVESVVLLPITIGAYQLDPGNRTRMIAQLVLTELVKMGRVIERFTHRYCRGGSTATMLETLDDGSGKGQLYLALRLWLRARLNSTVRIATSQLKED